VTWLAAAASVVVGVVFVVAGASKLASGPGWRASAHDLGAPDWVTPFVPWIELAIGALLIVQLAQPWPAIAALVMLVAFSMLIALRLRAGERPRCACFGQWSESEIGARHLVRNAVLAGLAVIAAIA
jgi:uncharacterized membrane protein YphA (DoxX/SURF4 family)